MKSGCVIALVALLTLLAIGCRNDCQELCESLQADFENVGVETDCASDLWTSEDTCAGCLEVLESLELSASDPEGLCEEYF